MTKKALSTSQPTKKKPPVRPTDWAGLLDLVVQLSTLLVTASELWDWLARQGLM